MHCVCVCERCLAHELFKSHKPQSEYVYCEICLELNIVNTSPFTRAMKVWFRWTVRWFRSVMSCRAKESIVTLFSCVWPNRSNPFKLIEYAMRQHSEPLTINLIHQITQCQPFAPSSPRFLSICHSAIANDTCNWEYQVLRFALLFGLLEVCDTAGFLLPHGHHTQWRKWTICIYTLLQSLNRIAENRTKVKNY